MKGDKSKNQRTYEYLSTKENGEQLWICDAIEWANETMINKACEWLRNNVDFYVETIYGEYFRVDIEQLLKDIRKAMEE